MHRFLGGAWKVIAFPFRALGWLIRLPFRSIRSIVRFMREEPVERPLGEVFASLSESEMARDSLVQQIEAFRKHLLRSVIWLVLGVGISFALIRK